MVLNFRKGLQISPYFPSLLSLSPNLVLSFCLALLTSCSSAPTKTTNSATPPARQNATKAGKGRATVTSTNLPQNQTSTANATSAPTPNPWSQFRSTIDGPAESIGTSDAGCLKGALDLADYFSSVKNRHLKFQNPDRVRYFGHELTRAYLTRVSAQLEESSPQHEIYIGDVSQPRGGPTDTGHASHQTGLDLDIWYDSQPDSILEVIPNSPNRGINESRWPQARLLVEAFADDELVDRLFVAPEIKLALCAEYSSDDNDPLAPQNRSTAPWLKKVRPWFGHDDHFHIRLKCSKADKLCKDQAALPGGDGCDDTLRWWFSSEAAKQAQAKAQTPFSAANVKLPAACNTVRTTPEPTAP